jgi:hypothetical protein
MKHPGYIGRRDYNAIRFPMVRSTSEKTMFHPVGVPFILHAGGIIF